MEDLDPLKWQEHHYGLPEVRWKWLENRAYWVTGAGSGFGLAMTTALASAGSQVFLTGRRKHKLAEAIEHMRSLGIPTDRCHPVPADVADPEQVESACEIIQRHCGSLQGLVNNAAVSQRTVYPYPLQQDGIESWDKIMGINTRGPWFVTKAALPHMLKGHDIRILFITSGAGWSFLPGYGHYNISKAALNSLTACFAEECDRDIQINGLDPGQARTEMNQGAARSPVGVACMALLLLSHPGGGPNGKFFSHDGRHLSFCNSAPHDKSLRD
jgi:3-oxoacyl-[acyl-carrier protein] reductase